MVAAIIPFLLLAGVLGDLGPAVVSLAFFAALFVAPTVFDAFAGGRTPGRRVAGLRLVDTDGGTVGFLPAVVRNILRIVDFLPSFYTVGVIAIFVSDRNQRLGDLAAGTLVVRHASRSAAVVPGSIRPDATVVEAPAGWDVTGVTDGDLAVVRSFLGRRADLEPSSRARVAGELARRLEPVVSGPVRSAGDEAFLESVVAAKETRSR